MNNIDKKGFTLIEIMIIIVLLSIISLLLTTNVIKWINESRINVIKSEENFVADTSDDLISDYYSSYAIYEDNKSNTYDMDKKNGYICLNELYDKNYLSSKISFSNEMCNGFVYYTDGKGKTYLICGDSYATDLKIPASSANIILENCNVDYSYPLDGDSVVIVTFDSNGGSEVEPKTIEVKNGARYGDYNGGYNNLPSPIRENYSFTGWYTEKENNKGKQISKDDIVNVTENITLYAHWKKRIILDEQCFTYYISSDNKAMISGWNKNAKTDEGEPCYGGALIIPEYLDGYPVVKITNRAFQNASPIISYISFPNSIEEVDLYSFSKSGLKSISSYDTKNNEYNEYPNTMPSSIKIIGQYAFNNNNLEELNFFDNEVEQIGSVAFSYNKLSSIKLPSVILKLGSASFVDNRMDKEHAFIYGRNSDGTEDKSIINSYAGSADSDIIIPDGVITILSQAFCSCNLIGYGLKTVEKNGKVYYDIPETLNKINDSAFSDNSIDKIADFPYKITLGGGVFSNNIVAGDNAFVYDRNDDGTENKTIINSFTDKSRKKIEIPENVVEIKKYAFRNVKIDTLIFKSDSKLTTIGSDAFRYSNIKEIKTISESGKELYSLPKSLTSVGYSILSKASIERDKENWICDLNKTENNKVFFCEDIPEDCKNDSECSIRLVSFNGIIANGNEKDKIPKYIDNEEIFKDKHIETIKSYTFYGNVNNGTAIVPKSIKKLESYAYSYGTINEVVFSPEIENIATNAFYNTSITDVYFCGKESYKELKTYGNSKLDINKREIYKFTGKKECKDYGSYSASINPKTGKEYDNSCVHWSAEKNYLEKCRSSYPDLY